MTEDCNYIDVRVSYGSPDMTKVIRVSYSQDFNGASQFGCGFPHMTTRRGRRETTATGFLKKASRRKNLKILLNAVVQEVIVTDGAAKGVRWNYKATAKVFVTEKDVLCRFKRDDVVTDVYANKEVILSAGVVATPQILMLSGIGPRKDRKASSEIVLPGLNGYLKGNEINFDDDAFVQRPLG